MPSTMTHTYFALDVYKELPTNIKKKIKNIEYLKLFAQGSDPFMFYNYFVGKKSKSIKNIQTKIHTTKTQDFFLNLITYVNDNNLSNKEEILSYLYGNICHYFLDLEIHPYIYYKTGIFNKNDKSTYKYNSLHQEMEYIIDIYFISKNESIPPNKFKVHRHIFTKVPFSNNLSKTINYVMSETYNIDNIVPTYIKSIKHMKNFFKYFNYDPKGIKKNIYSLVDHITSNNTIKLKELSFSNNYQEKLYYLNLEKNTWNHPCNKEETYNYSVIELYSLALSKAKKAIIEIDIMLETKIINIKRLKKIFTNLSYVTGKDCKENLPLKYFES